MPGRPFLIGIAVPQQRTIPSFSRRIQSAYCLARLAISILTVALIGGCQSVEQPTPEQLPVEAMEDIPGRIPLKAFASLPLVRSMRLSPSGEHIASIQNIAGGKTYLVVTTYDGKDVRKLLESDNRRYSIRWFDWVNDERLVVGVWTGEKLSGRRWTETRLLAINRDSSNFKTDLIRPSRDHNFFAGEDVPQLQDRAIGKITGDDRSVLIALDLRTAT